MVDLKRITKGKVERAPRVLLYSTDGYGKTSWAANAEDPFFIDANKGSLGFNNVQRIIPANWSEVKEWTAAVASGDVKCKTLVYDAVTDIETMSHLELFPGSTVDKYEGGYGKGDTMVIVAWRELLSQLERIWANGISIVFLAHCTVKRFEDPLVVGGYERFEVACRPKLAGLLRQWVDYVLFGMGDVALAGGKGENKKAVTTGARWLYTRRVPAYDAKARGTTMFPEKIPLSWAEFRAAIKNDDKRGEDLVHQIDAMLGEIADIGFEKVVREYVKQYPTQLVEAHNRVSAKLEEFRKSKEQSNG
jgi:hypothetical protein